MSEKQTRDVSQEKAIGIDKFSGSAILGKNIKYLIQATDVPIGSPAILPANQTEGSYSLGGDSASEQTKDGLLTASSTIEETFTFKQFYAAGDKALSTVMNMKKNGGEVKVWRVVLDKSVKKDITFEDGKKGGQYPALFAFASVDSVEMSDGDSFVEVDYSLNVVGQTQDGFLNISDEDVELINTKYDFQTPGQTTGSFSDGTMTDKPVEK